MVNEKRESEETMNGRKACTSDIEMKRTANRGSKSFASKLNYIPLFSADTSIPLSMYYWRINVDQR